MRVLLACEKSQIVCIEMREIGNEAFSCYIQECSGGHPEWHIQDDVLNHLDKKWDLMIAFPPCTHLAVSGARYFKEKQKDGRQKQAIDFIMKLIKAPIFKIVVENPIGIMSTIYRKPDQIIQPWQFGHPETKATCLWLKNLPKLIPTKIIKSQPAWIQCPDYDDYWCTIHKKHAYDCDCPDIDTWITKKGITPYEKGSGRWENETKSGQNKLGPSPERAELRAKTYSGIAVAMANQWGKEFKNIGLLY